ncbi:MAG: IS630 family transposase [Defluviitaleaceae bacterium]|nr:IS630 family transposase [Defluviitaleaceae bacterium]
MDKKIEVRNMILSPKEQAELRKRIIRTALKNLRPDGKVMVTKVSEICECSKSHVIGTWKKYQLGGVPALEAPKPGSGRGSGRVKLKFEKQEKIIKLIIDKYPDQLELKGFLWDRRNIQKLIKDELGIDIILQNLSTYIKNWGMTPQRPITKSYEQQPECIKKWLEEEYPEIKRKSKFEKGRILWGNVTAIKKEISYAKEYVPEQTFVIPTGNYKLRINMISVLSNRGTLKFMLYEGSTDAELVIKFMSKLIGQEEKKIFLILDNLSFYHTKIVREWLNEREDKIEVFFLPHMPQSTTRMNT